MPEYEFEIHGLRSIGGRLSGRATVRFIEVPDPPIEPPPTVDLGGYRPQMVSAFGMDSVGGRGPGGIIPVVIRMNSLADTVGSTLSGPTGAGTISNPFVYTGQLGAALLHNTPRFIVPEVSGYINIARQLRITNPYFTVAGQTAPGDGITVRCASGFGSDRGIYIATHNSVLQHFKIRPGSSSCNSALQYWNLDEVGHDIHHGLLDHMSITWAQDEGIGYVYDVGTSAIWRSIIAETLYGTPGSEICSGGGFSSGHGLAIGTGNDIAILQNLIAHNLERNPQIDGGSSGAIQNNVFYSPKPGPWLNILNGQTFKWRMDGNYFKRDSIFQSAETYAFRVMNAVAGSQLYLNDNFIDNGNVLQPIQLFRSTGGIDPRVGTVPAGTTVPGYTPLTSAATFPFVLSNAGARPLNRDVIDTRIVQSVQNRTGNYVSQVSEVGGYPTITLQTNTFQMPANPMAVGDSKGRLNIELYLEQLARNLEP